MNTAPNKPETIRNLKGFIRGYAKQPHAIKTLNRSSYRDKEGKHVWRNPSLAQALVQAAQ